ncbi:unnamed protein product [Linum trigynum]|uniref:RING-type E3 ubiquitin transferase n=1 Tax=Linum trigynum TaxID=586398 RepID=A0AAV2CDP8_9ROSI
MSTTSGPYAKYYCPPTEGCPPHEDPAWVHIFMWSCFIIFILTLNFVIFWMACTRQSQQPLGDLEQGHRRPQRPPDHQQENSGHNYADYKVNVGVDFVRWKAAGLGLRDEVLTKSSGRGSSLAQEEEECVICLGEFEDGMERSVLTVCSHSFHKVCLESWLVIGDRRISPTCPLCRASIGPPYARVRT